VRTAQSRLLSVGGLHLFETEGCQLIRAEPEDAVENLHWTGALALQAQREGVIEIVCGAETERIDVVDPARMTLVAVDGRTSIPAGERFAVRAQLYDHRGRELEVGKYSDIEWTPSGAVAFESDRSSGEFGISEGSFGVMTFRAVAIGEGIIEARLREARARLVVTSG
jgi:hypothetical protein